MTSRGGRRLLAVMNLIAVVGIVVGLSNRARLGTESPAQSLGGQFCSHVPTVGMPTAAAGLSRGSPAGRPGAAGRM